MVSFERHECLLGFTFIACGMCVLLHVYLYVSVYLYICMSTRNLDLHHSWK